MIIIYLNELKNVSMFVFNFNYIKDLSKIIMEQKCNNIYCEAETDRYQIAKNSYKLLLPNDIFNSKTYTIMVFIISIMIYLYYYYLLFDSTDSNKSFHFLALHLILLTILISMIILRYVPHDEAGYLNYFKEFNNPDNSFATFIKFFKYFIWVSMGLIPIIIIMIKNNNSIMMPADVAIPLLMKILCYLLSLVLLFNLMNIVMSFRTNTKPILKTKSLSWSLQKSFEKLYNDFTEGEKVVLEAGIKGEWDIFIALKDTVIASGAATSEQKISYIINIFIAFNELAKITLKGFTINEKDINSNYIKDLKNTIKDNNTNLNAVAASTIATKVSNVSLIYDKTVKIPATYNHTKEDLEKNQYLDEHTTNSNDNNTDYIYTADISYDSPNLFYEKYWDVNFGSMWKYDYFVPTILLGGYKPNLYTIFMIIVIVIIGFFIIHGIAMFAKTEGIDYSLLYTILQPLIMLVFLIGFILLFINFNTWFNKYVVYMCLDSSYKRSLNKLNNIVTPYIRMYDNKIIRGNKTYIRHYIIANVFYSILSGNIKLNDGGDLNPTLDQSSAITNRGKITAAYEAAKKANDDILLLLTNLYDVQSKTGASITQQKEKVKNSADVLYTPAVAKAGSVTVAVAEAGSATVAETTAKSAYYRSEKITAFIAALNVLNTKIVEIDITDITAANFVEKLAGIKTKVEAIITSQVASLSTAQSSVLASNEISSETSGIVNSAKESVTTLQTQINTITATGANGANDRSSINAKVKNAKSLVAYAKNIVDDAYRLQFTSVASATKLKNSLITVNTTEAVALTAATTESNIKTTANAYYKKVREAKGLSDIALRDAELAKNAEIKLNPDSSPLAPIDEDTKKTKEAKEAKYYDISRIKENRLKFANMNNSILSNDNEYREYYKGLYDNIYQETYTETQAEKLYKVFKDIFTKPVGAAANITTETGIDTYFKNHIITKDVEAKKEGTIDKIYLIIKKCIDLFDEEKFNNNLIYYNNPENKQKGIDIDSYAKFKFYKYGDNVIPYKFILNLKTTTEYDNFVKDIKTVAMTDFIKYTDSTDITKILEENDEEDLLSQASDIEKKQDKNLIKIIAKYLLILGHINYNRIEYNYASDATKKQEIYEKKSYYLYRLFSNILYDDTYDINDTFKTSTAPTLLITNAKYYNLTYIYNYLETKYVVISPNSNKNYLINIIKSINNKINDDDKTMNTDAKNARYLFREKINNKNNPEEYDNEEDILTIANNISTSSFIATYVCNIVVLTLYFIIISFNIKKSF